MDVPCTRNRRDRGEEDQASGWFVAQTGLRPSAPTALRLHSSTPTGNKPAVSCCTLQRAHYTDGPPDEETNKNTYTRADKHNKTDQLDITSSSLFGTDIYRGRPYTPICIINTYTHMILISSATHKPLIFTNEQETLLYTFRAVHNNFPSSGGEQHHLLNRMDRSEYEGLL